MLMNVRYLGDDERRSRALSPMAPPMAGCCSSSGCSSPVRWPLRDLTVPAGARHCCTSGCLTLLHLWVLDPVAQWVLHLLSQRGLPRLRQQTLIIAPKAGALYCYSAWVLGTSAQHCCTGGYLQLLHQQVLEPVAPAGA